MNVPRVFSRSVYKRNNKVGVDPIVCNVVDHNIIIILQDSETATNLVVNLYTLIVFFLLTLWFF